jgi:amino acid/amide ABC transporter membrane protein 1, HAAT family (TC 3.A.1.4.-)
MVTGAEFAQAIVSGLFIGAAYAVLGVGFSLIWGVTKVINLSHCAFALIAAYIAYWLLVLHGIDPILSLVITIPLLFLLGIALHQGFIKKTAKGTKDITSASMILTFGIIVIIENVLTYFCKADPRLLTTSYSGASFFLGDVAFPITNLISFALAAVTIAAIYLFLHRTYTGKAVQAVWQEREGAMLSGIDVDRVTAITYGLALASAAVGGTGMVLMYSITPTVDFTWLIFVFLVTIVGGLGSVIGTAAGGLIIGLVIGLCSAFIPLSLVNLVLFIMLIIVLLVKPRGLFQR